jgi:hypothetical protein
MDLLCELAGKDKDMPRHYAFLPSPSDEASRLNREHFLTARMIFPIWYDASSSSDHHEALESLLGILASDSAKISGR